MRKNRMLHVIVLRLAAVLLILVMFSASLLAGRYARYTSTISGSDSTKVARFSVTEDSMLLTQDITFDVSPTQADSVTITVTNDSEVAICYTIDVSTSGNLPLKFEVKVGEDTYPTPFEAEMQSETVTEYTLIASWNGSADLTYAGMVDLLQVNLRAIQID